MPHSSIWTLCLTLGAICLLWLSSSLSLSLRQVSEQANSSMSALQTEMERLMRSMSEKEAELSSLRQAAQAQQSSLRQEQEKSSRELGELQGKLKEKVRSVNGSSFSHIQHYRSMIKCNKSQYIHELQSSSSVFPLILYKEIISFDVKYCR